MRASEPCSFPLSSSSWLRPGAGPPAWPPAEPRPALTSPAAAFLNSAAGPRRQQRTEPSAEPRQPRAWPGARLLSSAFCNALPFYFTALHNAAAPPPLTPAAPGSRPRSAGTAGQERGGSVPTEESPPRPPMTAGWKVRSQPQHRPAKANWAGTPTALISSGSAQVRALTARHDTIYSSSGFNHVVICDIYEAWRCRRSHRLIHTSMERAERHWLCLHWGWAQERCTQVTTRRSEWRLRISMSKTWCGKDAKNSCGYYTLLHLLCKYFPITSTILKKMKDAFWRSRHCSFHLPFTQPCYFWKGSYSRAVKAV